jgi:hypothetical protein
VRKGRWLAFSEFHVEVTKMTTLRKVLAIGLLFFVFGAITVVGGTLSQPPALLAGDDPKLPVGG